MTSANFLETFASVTFQSGLVVFTTLILARIAKTVREQNRLWTVCHVSLIAIFFIVLLLPHVRLFPRIATLGGLDVASLLPLESRLGQSVLIVWGVGSGFSLLMLLVGSIRAIHFLKRSEAIVWDRLPHIFAKTAVPNIALENLSNTSIRFLTNSSLHSPFCWQIHRPTIVLPEYVLSFPTDELRLVILHEMEHLRAGHPLQLFLQRIVAIVYWFHPTIWLAARHADKSREMACDENTVSSRQEAAAFLKSLIRLAEHRTVPARLTAAGLAFGGGSSLVKQRADRVSRRNWTVESSSVRLSRWPTRCSILLQLAVVSLSMLVWFPVDVTASNRTWLSPWPSWSAATLQNIGIKVRDYEIDGHRLRSHEHLSRQQSVDILNHQKPILEKR